MAVSNFIIESSFGFTHTDGELTVDWQPVHGQLFGSNPEYTGRWVDGKEAAWAIHKTGVPCLADYAIVAEGFWFRNAATPALAGVWERHGVIARAVDNDNLLCAYVERLRNAVGTVHRWAVLSQCTAGVFVDIARTPIAPTVPTTHEAVVLQATGDDIRVRVWEQIAATNGNAPWATDAELMAIWGTTPRYDETFIVAQNATATGVGIFSDATPLRRGSFIEAFLGYCYLPSIPSGGNPVYLIADKNDNHYATVVNDVTAVPGVSEDENGIIKVEPPATAQNLGNGVLLITA